MRWIAVFLAMAVVAGCSIGDDERSPEAQAPSATQAQPRVEMPSTSPTDAPIRVYELEPPLAPTRYVRYAPEWRLVDAKVVGSNHTVRYVLQHDFPASALKHEMTSFLYLFGFRMKGRPMVVRLANREGRIVWAAGFDGVKEMWVRARFRLVGCGPIFYGERFRFRLPRAPAAADPRPCRRVKPPEPTIDIDKVLR